MDRTILHCDMNGFYASVELLERPDLRDKPMAVCGNPENRHGIILAKNELAKKFGVVTAETIWQAKQKCPGLQLVKPHHEKYHSYSKKINQIYERFTDMVEPFSIDESWLDVTGSLKLFGSGEVIADQIRNTAKDELGLTLSVGVSFNKIFAKMGSEYKKPDATTLITRDNFKEILWPLPINELFFVGKVTEEKLRTAGINTIGEAAVYDKNLLVKLLGKQGEQVYIYANGLEDSPVCKPHEMQKIKSVGNGITFRRNLTGLTDVKTALTGLADKVAGRLRQNQILAGGVKIDIKDPYFKVISRQVQLTTPTNLAEELSNEALNLLKASWNLKDPIRMLTLTAIYLQNENEGSCQLSLFSMDEEKREKVLKLEETMDHIRSRFGTGSITFGSIIGNDMGIDLYDEEDSD